MSALQTSRDNLEQKLLDLLAYTRDVAVTSQEAEVQAFMDYLLPRFNLHDTWYVTKPADIIATIAAENSAVTTERNALRALLDERTEKQLLNVHKKAWDAYLLMMQTELTVYWNCDWTLTPNRLEDGSPGAPTYAPLVNGVKGTVVPGIIYDVLGGNKHSSGDFRPSLFTVGDILILDAGIYDNFRLTLDKAGVNPGEPQPFTKIIARELGTCVIAPPSSGKRVLYDEWRDFPVQFDNIVLRCPFSWNGGIYATENPGSSRWGGGHPGFSPIRFSGCTFDGGWNAELDTGPHQKWAMNTIGPWRTWDGGPYAFDLLNCFITGMWDDEGRLSAVDRVDLATQKLLQAKGSTFRWLGGAALKESFGPDSACKGLINIEDCYIEDVSLKTNSPDHALTFKGNLDGKITIKDTVSRLGSNIALKAPRNKNIGGHLQLRTFGSGVENGITEVEINGCDFETGPGYVGEGAARKPAITVGEPSGSHLVVGHLKLLNTRIVQNAGATEALNVKIAHLTHWTLSRNNPIVGRCVVDGVSYSTYQDMITAIEGNPKVTVV